MHILGSVLALSALSFYGTTENNSPRVEAAPSITAHRLTSPPVIDGKLMDDCWREAEVASDFWRSDGSSRANPSASVQLVFDDENLYVGFRCPLSDPQSVMNAKQPDQMLDGNTAQVFLDPLLDHRRDVGIAEDPDALFYTTPWPKDFPICGQRCQRSFFRPNGDTVVESPLAKRNAHWRQFLERGTGNSLCVVRILRVDGSKRTAARLGIDLGSQFYD